MAFVLVVVPRHAGGVVYLLLVGGATPGGDAPGFTLALLMMVVIGGTGTSWARSSAARSTPADHRLGDARRRTRSRGCRRCYARRSRAALRARRAVHPRRLLRAGRARRGSARGRGALRARSALRAARRGRMRIAWESRGRASRADDPGARLRRAGAGSPSSSGARRRFRVLSFDNRGIGESDDPAGPYSVEADGRDACPSWTRRGSNAPTSSVRDSAAWSPRRSPSRRPERVDRLVLACTHAGRRRRLSDPERDTARSSLEAATLAPDVALRRFVENGVGPDAPRN